MVLAVGLVVIAVPALIVFLSVKLTLPRIGLIKGLAMFVGLTVLFNMLLLPAQIGWIPALGITLWVSQKRNARLSSTSAASLPKPVVEDTIKGG